MEETNYKERSAFPKEAGGRRDISTALTVIDSGAAVMVLLATDVAVTVAVEVTERVAGAVYTTVVVVLSLSTCRDRKESDITPPFVLSLATVAVMVVVCPGFSESPDAGASVTVRTAARTTRKNHHPDKDTQGY